jgi:hypothetical protein
LYPVHYLLEDGSSVFRICEVRLTPVNYDFTLGMDQDKVLRARVVSGARHSVKGLVFTQF